MTKTVVITGANSGIGLGMAHELAARGATLVFGCRNQAKAEVARKAVVERTPGAEVDVLSLDLSSFDHIRTFAKELAARHDRVDALINNAGASPIKQHFTDDGFEMQFGANYLGPFLLTHLLLPQLQAAATETGDARVVHLSSVMHNIGSIDPDTFTGRERYFALAAYAQSKLGNLMFSNALARRLPAGITSTAMHPGGVDSEVYRELPALVLKPLRLFLISPDKPSKLGADLAIGDRYRGRSGEYFTAQPPGFASRTSRDIGKQDDLYRRSAALTDIEALAVR
ncbi:SDR family NAD(P)-dependent oxidoreductase [Antrihabitans spumae]|jgi:NAD(P)-dependent dehydrogenase (short-subunit alcohol dehydrogenase family)|uniref:SDR family NAD(P)-dependent oxidoreductase n=1 Tax=Antrihabitans spumae TaxID=3373370 RepID=A0ABW7K1K8_9NOCA